jgi:hypothetical protein
MMRKTAVRYLLNLLIRKPAHHIHALIILLSRQECEEKLWGHAPHGKRSNNVVRTLRNL